jgi:Alpha/beta hydrolase domain
MRTRGLMAAAAALLAATSAPGPGEARVVRFEVEQTRLFADGMEWGHAGAYERLDGRAYFEVDPFDPRNAVIVNLDKAPRNAEGMVEFSSPFFILKPVDMARGNQKLFYGINNRGNKIEIARRAFPTPPEDFPNANDPLTAADIGDGLLLRQGYAYVDAGWHGDGIPDPDDVRLFPDFPVATNPDGSPIVAAKRLEYQPAEDTFTLPLVSGWKPYEAADTDTSNSTLTVRDHPDDPRIPMPDDAWAFGSCPSGEGSLEPTATDLCLFEGFEAQRIYELVYPAKDPIVMGLAYAVTRDVGSFLRHQIHDDAGNPNPLALAPSEVGIRRAYSSGTSSTGMYQREFLYFGFNEDEEGRQVFDGVTIFTAGTHRLFANVEFAHPTFYSGQDQHHDFTSNSFPPFTFAVTTDPISGVTDGILKRPETDPKVMQLDGELEIWQWKGSLNVADSLGNPLPVPDGVRLYLNSGYGHTRQVAGLLSPARPGGLCQNVTHGLGGTTSLRALTVAMDEWADKGIEPPDSNYPRLEDGTLVTLEAYRKQFPIIPGAAVPTVMNELDFLDFGPQFTPEGGRQTILPPLPGPRYTVLVPKPDEDGVNIAGIRPMEIRAPLGTNVGWNVKAGFRAPDLCSLSGSYFPFATTEEERVASGDPRQSLEERYGSQEGFVRAVRRAAGELVRERFLLEEDARTFLRAARDSDILKEDDMSLRAEAEQ